MGIFQISYMRSFEVYESQAIEKILATDPFSQGDPPRMRPNLRPGSFQQLPYKFCFFSIRVYILEKNLWQPRLTDLGWGKSKGRKTGERGRRTPQVSRQGEWPSPPQTTPHTNKPEHTHLSTIVPPPTLTHSYVSFLQSPEGFSFYPPHKTRANCAQESGWRRLCSPVIAGHINS